MPSINDFVGKKNSKTKKSSEWSLPTISKPASTPQRRPGRGEDAPLHPEPGTKNQADLVQTGSKEVANTTNNLPLSSEHNAAKQAANGYQSDSKQVANREQTGSKEVAETSSDSATATIENPKRVAQRVAQRVANREQTGSKEVAETSFETLVGKERSLLLFIVEECQINGDLKTGPLTLERISEVLGCSANRAKNVLHRLSEKSLIYRAEAKTGRGGWTRFGLSKELFQRILLSETGSKGIANGYQTGSKEVAKQVAQRVAGGSSSSSFLDSEILKTTTTGEAELFDDGRVQLSPDWAGVDFSPLTDVGFSRAHLVQLAKHGKLSTAEVQDSIHFFAFDLKRNGKGREIKGSPVNFFMGILRKGLPYAPPENYESPEQAARRIYLDGKRRLEEQRLAEERELRDLEFAEWRRGLAQDQIAKIVPDVVRDIIPARESSLKAHFDENVWPDRRAAVPGLVAAEQADIRQQIEQSLGQGSTS